MKKIIISLLVTVTTAFTLLGCENEEVMQLYESEVNDEITDEKGITELSESVSDDIAVNTEVISENSEEMAENTNDSRPFVVYVTGEVKKQGVYELKEGSRVIDAIVAAGGYTDNASETYLNLAKYVSDEQMIYVPSDEEAKEHAEKLEGEGANETVKGGDEKQNGATKIDLNSASKEDLMTLPGIGESKAEKIIAYRDENGGFSSPEGIMEISGIKDGLFNKIKDRICVR